MRRYSVPSGTQYATRAAALAGSRPHTISVVIARGLSVTLRRLANASARSAAAGAFLSAVWNRPALYAPGSWFGVRQRTGIRPGAFADGVYGGVGTLEHTPGPERPVSARLHAINAGHPRLVKRFGSYVSYAILVREAEADAAKRKAGVKVRVRKPKADKSSTAPARRRKVLGTIRATSGDVLKVRSIRRQASPSPVTVARIHASAQAQPAPLQVAALPRSERRAARAAAHRQAVATA